MGQYYRILLCNDEGTEKRCSVRMISTETVRS